MNEVKHTTKYNSTVDSLRVLAVIFVLYQHIELVGSFHPKQFISLPFANLFSVPFFFFITGFYLSAGIPLGGGKSSFEILEIRSNRIIKSIKLHLKYILIGIFFSLAVNLFCSGILLNINIDSFINLFVFNNPFLILLPSAPMWYLFAAVYSLAIIYFFNRKLKNTLFLKIIMAILLILYYCGVYLLTNKEIIFTPYYKNFIFIGLPFICFGYIIGEYSDKITIFFKEKYIFVFFVIVNILIILIYLINFYIFIYSSDVIKSTMSGKSLLSIDIFRYYTPFFLLFIMILFSRFPNMFSKKIKFIPSWGRKYVVYIFIYHYPIYRVINKFDLVRHIGGYNSVPFIIISVFFMSLFLGFLTDKMVDLISK